MGPPPGIFSELGHWRDKAIKRGKPTAFDSDIIPGWLNVQIVEAQKVYGPEATFSFLKQVPLSVRMKAEREIKRKIQSILSKYERRAAQSIRRGEQFDYAGMADELRAAVMPEISNLVLDSAMRLSVDTGIAFDPAVINTEALNWARDYSFDLVQGLTSTTRNQLAEATAAFVQTPGMTIGDITKLIQPAFGPVRSEMIAITETTRAYSMATNRTQELLQAETPELTVTRVWNTMNDEITCFLCGPLEGAPETEWAGLGADSSGPPRHPNCRCSSSIRFETPEELALNFEQRQEARQAWLEEQGLLPAAAAPAPQLTERPIPASEQAAIKEIEGWREAIEATESAGGDASGLRDILSGLEAEYRQEQGKNDALWRVTGTTPGQATETEWRLTAQTLKSEGYDLYKKYTKDGIQQYVSEIRGAKESGYMVVGKEQIMVRRGAFSVRKGQRIQGEMWAQAKDDLSDAMGGWLRDLGFSSDDISNASFEQRRRLLEELGEKDLLRTARGTPSKIDAVPIESRERVIGQVGYDDAATAANVAIDPLYVPTLDAYGKMELSDIILATMTGQEPSAGYTALNF